MPSFFRRLGLRVSAAVSLTVLVILALAVARLFGEPERSTNSTHFPTTASSSALSDNRDDGVEKASLPPRPIDEAAIRAVANKFIQAWLTKSLEPEVWHHGLSRYSSPRLIQTLQGVDPNSVPATRMTGPLLVALGSETVARARVSVNTGTLQLTIVKIDNTWLVDTVDWERL